MLQQTQVNTVVPYFERWMIKFPSVSVLAKASEDSVLTQWEGLGYYTRARNLLKSAKLIVSDYNGVLPSNVKDLLKLPGVGKYTAAAIASIAFGEDVVALDGNIKRVLSRLFNVTLPVDSSAGNKVIFDLAVAHLPSGQAGDFNQGLMDLGAMICTPKNPDCRHCPLAMICKAKKLGNQNELPRTAVKPQKSRMTKAAVVVQKEKKVLLIRHEPDGLLGGLWEFPSIETDSDSPSKWTARMRKTYGLTVGPVSNLVTIRHTYTHIELTEHVFLGTLKKEPEISSRMKWVPVNKLNLYPMGKVDRTISKKLMDEDG